MTILNIHVYDVFTGRGLPYASIIVYSKETGARYVTVTDANGYASIRIPEGTYTISVRVFNYEPYDTTIVVKGPEVTLNVPLRMLRL